MRVGESTAPLSSSFDGNFEGAYNEDQSVSGGVGDGVGDAMAGNVADHLDPSRLPPAQRQLFMRIQQKQHRDEINNKPISELTAKRE